MFEIIETEIPEVKILIPEVYEDERGYFFESYNKFKLENLGLDCEFVQDNQSKSKYGTLRGLHYQHPPYDQAKLVRVLKGKVLDVAVDIRIGSPYYGKYVAVELSDENKKQLFIPRGFAHGFVVLSDFAEFFYKCDNYYNPQAEAGIRYDDPDLNINWQIPKNDIIVSKKDSILPNFKNALILFSYQ